MLRPLCALALILLPAVAGAQELNELTGTVGGFECGDNCYLTVDLGEAGALTALCVAEACTPWNEAVEMPEELVGAPVRVVVDIGYRYTGEEELSPYIAFTSVTIAP